METNLDNSSSGGHTFAHDVPTPRHASACPVEEVTSMLGHRWTALVLWHLSTGPKRFGALRDCLVGVTQKVLTDRLTVLVEHDVVIRSQPADFPRRVTYRLSDRGERLIPILDQLERWAQQA